MAGADHGPLTDAEGDVVRDLHDDEMPWLIRAADFPGGLEEMARFSLEREQFLDALADEGIPREAFLALEPSKPGFLDRVRAAMARGEAAVAAE